MLDGGADGGFGGRPDGSMLGDDAGGLDGGTNHAVGKRAHVVSVPPGYAVAEEPYTYKPKTSEPTSEAWAIKRGPQGAAIDSDGASVKWSPSAAQKGAHELELENKVGTSSLHQKVQVTVAVAEKRAETSVDEKRGGSVTVSSPKSKIQGAAVQVSSGGVKEATTLSVSELDRAPAMHGGKGSHKAVKFGPKGTVFKSPALVALPLPDDVELDEQRLGAYLYDVRGRWLRVPIVRKDLARRLLFARAPHFSVYAAAQSSLGLTLSLARTAEDGACAGQLAAQAILADELSAVDARVIGNASDALLALIEDGTSNLEDVLLSAEFTGSLRFVRVFELLSGVGAEQVSVAEAVRVTTVVAPGDGSAAITHTDALGNVLASTAIESLVDELDVVSAYVRGEPTRVLFAGTHEGSLALAGRLHVVYFEDDASIDPTSTDDLGVAAVDALSEASLIEAEGRAADLDCDGVLDAFDAEDGRLLPRFVAAPDALLQTTTNTWARLSATLTNAPSGTTVTWQVLSKGGELASVAGTPNARDFRANAPGRYLVEVRAKLQEESVSHVFAIDVAARATPPLCTPSPASTSLKVGDAAALTAVLEGSDVPAGTLQIEWGLLSEEGLFPSDELMASGTRALFKPRFAAEYEVGCRARTAHDEGALGTTRLSVVGAEQNRLPVDLVLSPPSATLSVGESLTLSASAMDPDGDAITFAWSASGGTLGAGSDAAGESRRAFTSAAPGLFSIRVQVSDAADLPQTLVAELLVIENEADLDGADADGDGWPVGLDCDDANAGIHPGAKDRCGDDIDDDCSGTPRSSDCDLDGFTLDDGDCDDEDASRHPGASERCDGLDNDCDGELDEGFGLSLDCTVGVGACAVRGRPVCSADGASSVCQAQARLPSIEICDGLDNDCDGLVDEAYVSRATNCGVGECVSTGATSCFDGQELDSCVPKPPAFSDDASCNSRDDDCDGNIDEDYPVTATACGAGACAAEGTLSCQNGTVVDSCKPKVAATVDAACDGIDDDCDGDIDEDYVSTSVTCGLGACASTGVTRCEMGSLLESCTPLPAAASDATCDGVDDDCNGQVDEDAVPLQEVCNDVDDDCDGLVDEALNCGSAPSGECTPTGAEICNALDDDCNGQIDDGVCDLTPVEGSLVGVWWECTDSTCTNLRDSGLMFPAGGTGHFLRSFDGRPYVPAEGPYCVEGEDALYFDLDGQQVNFQWTEDGELVAGLATFASEGTRATITWLERPGPECAPEGPTTEICGDGVDQDCDGCEDEEDEDCGGNGCDVIELLRIPEQPGGLCPFEGGPQCEPVEACGQGFDLDCDGCPDSQDTDCGGPGCGCLEPGCGGGCGYEVCGNGSNDDCDEYEDDATDPDCLPSCTEEPGQTECGEAGETCLNAIGLGVGTPGTPFATGARNDLEGNGLSYEPDRMFWFDVPPGGAEVLLGFEHALEADPWRFQATLYPAPAFTVGEACPDPNAYGFWSIPGEQRDFQVWLEGGRYLLIVEGPYRTPFVLRMAMRSSEGDCSVPDGDGDLVTVCDRDCDDGNPAVHPYHMVCDGHGCTPVEPGTELCNGLDDDCDGVVDNVRGSCTTGLPGVCAQGVRMCAPDGSGTPAETCEPAQQSAQDYCGDAVDNDCDGQVDEECVDDPGESCSNAIPMGLGGTFTGDLSNANDDAVSACGGEGPEVFYSLTLETTTQVYFDPSALHQRNQRLTFYQDCTLSTPDCGGPSSLVLEPGTYVVSIEQGDPYGDTTYQFSMWLTDLEGTCLTPDGDGDGMSLCQNDCDDSDAAIRPAGVDGNGDPIQAGSEGTTCDQRDNDCNGMVDDLGPCTVSGATGVCAQGRLTCDGVSTVPYCTSLTSPGQFVEVCGDGVDNDCDPGTSDDAELLQCTQPGVAGETCGSAIPLGEGGIFAGTLAGALDNGDTGCGAWGSPEQYFTFTLSEPRRVSLRLWPSEGAHMGSNLALSLLGASCHGQELLRCGLWEEASLVPGTYFVAVHGDAPVDYALQYSSTREDGSDCLPAITDDGDGYSICQYDCDPYNPAIGPEAQEICDGVDNNCDGGIDEGCSSL